MGTRATPAQQNTEVGGRRPNGSRTRVVVVLLIVVAVIYIYFLRHSDKPPNRSVPNASVINNTQAALIERKGVQELSSESNVPTSTLSPETKKLGEAVLSALQLAGDGKDQAKLQQATTAISRLIEQHPDYGDAYILRATYSLMYSRPNLRQIRDDADAALKYHASLKYASAYSSDASIYALRAKADVFGADYRQAIIDLESAVEVNPRNPNEVFNTGGVKPEEDANPTALQKKDFDTLVARYPQDYRTYMFRGLFYGSFTTYGEQYYAPTFADLNRALEVNPKSALVHYFLGTTTQKMTFWSQAAARDISDMTGAKGGYKERVHQKALQQFEAAVTLDPTFAPSYSEAADELLSLKRYSDALPYYDRVIQLQPDNSGAYNDRGLAKSNLGSFYDAISDYSRAIDLKKSHNGTFLGDTYENRAVAYSKTGNYDSAIEDYTRAIGLKLREQVFLMSIPQIRAMYPELSDISTDDLLEGLRQKYFPNMSQANFTGQYRKNKQFDDFVLAELYVKRGDTYLAAQNFRKAAAEYSRAVHDDSKYAIDRWKTISKSSNMEYFIDTQTLSFTNGKVVSLWVKAQKVKSANYNQSNYQIDCGDRKIKSLSSANYDSSGSPKNSIGEQQWETIAPETLGEFLYNGMCR
jgi:tetratricopeptide (TPR) repeat protein